MHHRLAQGCGVPLGRDCLGCETRPHSICAALPEGDLLDLQVLSTSVRFGTREMLMVQGQPATSLYTITCGCARLYTLLSDGRRQIVGFALPGDFIGLSLAQTAGVSADAIGPVMACAFPRAGFSRFVDARPTLLRRLHEQASHELSLAQEQLMLLGRRNAQERIVCFLLGLQQRFARIGRASVTVPLPMGRQDIADCLGLTIETVSRTLTRLSRERMILLVPDGVRLLNAERLAAIAAG
ncbi:nitrogen fixation protein FixK [Bosea sp. AAP35]|uniref:Crp/Fnr family transcriptional regulator n=1 Tax=Bosea sp. AAP35 TaxID=1523417 RepID=UPI0006B8B2FF|nr:helix-turn-helix domain-containing protein [Bosea sp. AAP35]KPF62117.1 nitrogen fixation protein FixK [Bosea sp. AAP35]